MMAEGGSTQRSAGAGRGFVNPKTIAEMEKRKKKGIRGGIWTEESGVPVPQEPKGMRKGGYVCSADGIAKRGKTRGKFI